MQIINCLIYLFIGVAIKLAALVSWHNCSVLVLIFWTARNIPTIVITTEIDLKSLKVIFNKPFVTIATLFCCLYIFSVRLPQIFQVEGKISTNTTCVFPDHLSVFYDYGARNLDEYFHFYNLLAKKFKKKEMFEKN